MAKKRKHIRDDNDDEGEEENKNVRQITVKDIINSAINKGFSELLNNHPRIKNYEDILYEHIDWERLSEKEKEIYENLSDKGYLSQEDIQYIHEEMKNYVASSLAFDPLGQSLTVGKGLEERVNENGCTKMMRNVHNLSYAEENFQKTLDKIGRAHV